MTETVGIVIVSHSSDIAKGTADMVRQMVGSEVRRLKGRPAVVGEGKGQRTTARIRRQRTQRLEKRSLVCKVREGARSNELCYVVHALGTSPPRG